MGLAPGMTLKLTDSFYFCGGTLRVGMEGNATDGTDDGSRFIRTQSHCSARSGQSYTSEIIHVNDEPGLTVMWNDERPAYTLNYLTPRQYREAHANSEVIR